MRDVRDDVCWNYHGGNPESDDANRFTTKARDSFRIIQAFLDHPDGLTCDELEVLLGMRHQTCSARCADLKRARVLIPKSREPRWQHQYERRATRTGCRAAVLVLRDPSLFRK